MIKKLELCFPDVNSPLKGFWRKKFHPLYGLRTVREKEWCMKLDVKTTTTEDI